LEPMVNYGMSQLTIEMGNVPLSYTYPEGRSQLLVTR